MCITFLNSEYNNIDLFIEHVRLTLNQNGRLAVSQVADFFLTPKSNWGNAKMLCISPHNLVSDGKLTVGAVAAPGAGGPNDIFYKDAHLYEASYKAQEQLFRISLPSPHHSATAAPLDFQGKVITPQAYIPSAISKNDLAMELMEECGTIFELDLGNLKGGMRYAFRLVIQPSGILGLPEVRSQDIKEVDLVLSNWVQDAVIMCPKMCYYNYIEMIERARSQLEEYAEAAAIIQTLVRNPQLKLMPVKRGQIVLILPNGAELIADNPAGCIWKVSTYTLSDGQLAVVWATGAEEYWIDDPESVTRRIYKYVRKWGTASPRSKEHVSTATEAGHENSSMIIDEMCNGGLLTDVGNGRYKAEDKPAPELEEGFRKIAASKKVAETFKWMGFRIDYSVHYRYVSPDELNFLSKQRLRRYLTFWIAIIGLIIAIISLIVTLAS